MGIGPKNGDEDGEGEGEGEGEEEEEEEGGEDNVFLLATIFDAVTERSSVCVFDGRNIETGPVAQLRLAHRLPHSLHGCFTEDVF